MARGCERCGSFRGLMITPTGRRLCTEHWHRAQSGAAIVNLVLVTVFAAVAAGLTERSFAVVAATLVPALFVTLLVVNATHVLAATLVGLRLDEITVGTGIRIAAFGSRSPRLVVRLLPMYNSVEAAVGGNPKRLRWRLAWAAFAAAGPAALLAIVVLAAPHADSPVLLTVTVVAGFLLWLQVMALASARSRQVSPLWQAAARLWRPAPVAIDTPGGWTMTTSEFWGHVDAVYGKAAHGNHGAALDDILRLRAAQPNEASYECAEIDALAHLGRYDEARDRTDDMLRREPPEPHRAHAHNMRAWIDALTGGDPAVMRAHIDAALATLPDEPAVVGTAALVTAHEGRWDDAVALCDFAERGLSDPRQRATIDATRAYVAHHQGDDGAAAAYADAARGNDPDCVVLDLLPADL